MRYMPYTCKSGPQKYTANLINLNNRKIVKSHSYSSLGRAVGESVCMYYEQVNKDRGIFPLEVPSKNWAKGKFTVISKLTGVQIFSNEELRITLHAVDNYQETPIVEILPADLSKPGFKLPADLVLIFPSK